MENGSAEAGQASIEHSPAALAVRKRWRTVTADDHRRYTDVKEWGNLRVYWGPCPVLLWQRLVNLQKANRPYEALVTAVVELSEDKDGNRLFRPEDRNILLHEAEPRILEVLGKLMTDHVTIEDAEKNSDPSLTESSSTSSA